MTTGLLFMAYGSPRSLEEVAPYYTDIRGGRPPSPDALLHLQERYRSIGGRSPLEEVTRHQAAAVEARLRDGGTEVRSFVGMKHWHPIIAEIVAEIASAGIARLIGIVLAPHFSKMSIGGYEEQVLKARAQTKAGFEFVMIPHWYDDQKFIEFVAANLRDTIQGWAMDGRTRVFFTAHSLPERILAAGDPYRDQLHESSKLIADAASVTDWEFAFQSASTTGEPWLGPDILDRMESFQAEGGSRAMIAPIGFTADHLEVLYDVDIECAAKARKLGLEMRRIPSPNDDPRFIDALAGIVGRYL